MSKTILLNADQINTKIERLAYEIYESNYDEKYIHLVGIKKRGTAIAKKINKVLSKISDLEVSMHTIDINKAQPNVQNIDFLKDVEELDRRVVVLVDDVANTGRTLCYAIKPLLEHLPKKIQITVLIDRNHKAFPIYPDFIGLALSTTLKEHVKVSMESKKEEALLI